MAAPPPWKLLLPPCYPVFALFWMMSKSKRCAGKVSGTLLARRHSAPSLPERSCRKTRRLLERCDGWDRTLEDGMAKARVELGESLMLAGMCCREGQKKLRARKAMRRVTEPTAAPSSSVQNQRSQNHGDVAQRGTKVAPSLDNSEQSDTHFDSNKV